MLINDSEKHSGKKKISQWDVEFFEEAADCMFLSGDCSSVMVSKVVGEGWKADDYYCR